MTGWSWKRGSGRGSRTHRQDDPAAPCGSRALVPQSRSLMPELLLRDLTAQQVADLLEFMASLR